ncbi:hypothetical protein, partial [Nocardioides sp.]|uniref:hypothetical protein n=1 Tax=Nocardioides sp. TaxID=35761 RepID=UPI003D110D6E
TFLREHPDQTLLVHANRVATDPVVVPTQALGPGVAALPTVVGSAASVTGDQVSLPGAAGVSLYTVTSP